MAYLGNKPVNNFVSFAKQNITGNGGTSYSLDYPVTGANDIELFINNVRQEPTEAYSCAGSTLTLTGAVSSTDDVYVIFRGRALQTAQHPSDSALEAASANIDNGTLVVDAINDRVGIGTSSPSSTLHLANDSGTYLTIDSQTSASSNGNASISLLNDVGGKADILMHRSGLTQDFVFRANASAEGILFRTNGNNDRMYIDSSGRVTKPYQPAFRARLGSVINNPNGQVIAFTVSEFDTGSNYSTSTYRYTAPVAGKYFFGVRFYASIRSGGLRVLHNHWRVNGSNVLDATMAGGTGGDGGYSSHPTVHDTCILSLNANDYVEFYNASRSSTGNFDLENGYFYGHLIG